MTDTDLRLISWASLVLGFTLTVVGWPTVALIPCIIAGAGGLVLLYRHFTGGGGGPLRPA